MKELLEKGKDFAVNHKKIAIPCGVALIVVILLVIKATVGAGGKSNYFTLLNKNFSTTVGNFDYKIEVRSQEMTVAEEKEEVTAEELQNTQASEDISTEESSDDDILKVNEVINDGSHDDAYTDSWGNATNTADIDWTYPNYTIEFKGRVEETDPLKMNMDVILKTPYNNNTIVGMTYIDDKVYFDISKFRNWLLTSKDAYLMSLAEDIPESAIYVVGSKDEGLHFYSSYAEDSEFEIAGTYNALEMYNRFLVLEQTLANGIVGYLPKGALTSSQDKYYLKVSGDDSIYVYSMLKDLINGSGSTYNTYITNLNSNGLMTDEQVTQAANEKDNFLEAISDKWIWINSSSTADLQARNLVMEGVSNTYETPNIGTSYEASLNIGFNDTDTNTRYTISFTGTKQPLAVNSDNGVILPSGATMEMKDFREACDFEPIVDDVVYYLDIFNIFGRTKLKKNGMDVVNSMTDDLVATVNRKNKDNPNWKNITKYTVYDYINKYGTMQSSDDQYESMNIKLVKNFMLGLNKIKGDTVVTETVVTEAEVERFREVNTEFTALPFTQPIDESAVAEENAEKTEKTETTDTETSDTEAETDTASTNPADMSAEEILALIPDEELQGLLDDVGIKYDAKNFDREKIFANIDAEKMFADAIEEYRNTLVEPSVNVSSDYDVQIIANVNEDECSPSLICVDAIFMNETDTPISLDLTKFSLQNMVNDKFTMNYPSTLHEYDNAFDLTHSPMSVTIPGGNFVKVKLYTVVTNGFEYFDLFYGDTKLGDIVAY